MGRLGRNARALNRNSHGSRNADRGGNGGTRPASEHSRQSPRTADASAPHLPPTGAVGAANEMTAANAPMPGAETQPVRPFSKEETAARYHRIFKRARSEFMMLDKDLVARFAAMGNVEEDTVYRIAQLRYAVGTRDTPLFNDLTLSLSGLDRFLESVETFIGDRLTIPRRTTHYGKLVPADVLQPEKRFQYYRLMHCDGIFFFLRCEYSAAAVANCFRALVALVWLLSPALHNAIFIARGASPVLVETLLLLLRHVGVGPRDRDWVLCPGYQYYHAGSFIRSQESEAGAATTAQHTSPPFLASPTPHAVRVRVDSDPAQVLKGNGGSTDGGGAESDTLLPLTGLYLGYFRADRTFLFSAMSDRVMCEDRRYAVGCAVGPPLPLLGRVPDVIPYVIDMPHGVSPLSPEGRAYIEEVQLQTYVTAPTVAANSLPGPYQYFSRYSKRAFHVECLLYLLFALLCLRDVTLHRLSLVLSTLQSASWASNGSTRGALLLLTIAVGQAVARGRPVLDLSATFLAFAGQSTGLARLYNCYSFALLLATLTDSFHIATHARAQVVQAILNSRTTAKRLLARPAGSSQGALYRCVTVVINTSRAVTLDFFSYDVCAMLALWFAVVSFERAYRFPLTAVYAAVSIVMMLLDRGPHLLRRRDWEERILLLLVFGYLQWSFMSARVSPAMLHATTSVVRVMLVVMYVNLQHCGYFAPLGTPDTMSRSVTSALGPRMHWPPPPPTGPAAPRYRRIRELLYTDYGVSHVYAVLAMAMVFVEWWYVPRESYPYATGGASASGGATPTTSWVIPLQGAREFDQAIDNVYGLYETVIGSRFVAALPLTFLTPFAVTTLRMGCREFYRAVDATIVPISSLQVVLTLHFGLQELWGTALERPARRCWQSVRGAWNRWTSLQWRSAKPAEPPTAAGGACTKTNTAREGNATGRQRTCRGQRNHAPPTPSRTASSAPPRAKAVPSEDSVAESLAVPTRDPVGRGREAAHAPALPLPVGDESDTETSVTSGGLPTGVAAFAPAAEDERVSRHGAQQRIDGAGKDQRSPKGCGSTPLGKPAATAATPNAREKSGDAAGEECERSAEIRSPKLSASATTAAGTNEGGKGKSNASKASESAAGVSPTKSDPQAKEPPSAIVTTPDTRTKLSSTRSEKVSPSQANMESPTEAASSVDVGVRQPNRNRRATLAGDEASAAAATAEVGNSSTPAAEISGATNAAKQALRNTTAKAPPAATEPASSTTTRHPFEVPRPRSGLTEVAARRQTQEPPKKSVEAATSPLTTASAAAVASASSGVSLPKPRSLQSPLTSQTDTSSSLSSASLTPVPRASGETAAISAFINVQAVAGENSRQEKKREPSAGHGRKRATALGTEGPQTPLVQAQSAAQSSHQTAPSTPAAAPKPVCAARAKQRKRVQAASLPGGPISSVQVNIDALDALSATVDSGDDGHTAAMEAERRDFVAELARVLKGQQAVLSDPVATSENAPKPSGSLLSCSENVGDPLSPPLAFMSSKQQACKQSPWLPRRESTHRAAPYGCVAEASARPSSPSAELDAIVECGEASESLEGFTSADLMRLLQLAEDAPSLTRGEDSSDSGGPWRTHALPGRGRDYHDDFVRERGSNHAPGMDDSVEFIFHPAMAGSPSPRGRFGSPWADAPGAGRRRSGVRTPVGPPPSAATTTVADLGASDDSCGESAPSPYYKGRRDAGGGDHTTPLTTQFREAADEDFGHSASVQGACHSISTFATRLPYYPQDMLLAGPSGAAAASPSSGSRAGSSAAGVGGADTNAVHPQWSVQGLSSEGLAGFPGVTVTAEGSSRNPSSVTFQSWLDAPTVTATIGEPAQQFHMPAFGLQPNQYADSIVSMGRGLPTTPATASVLQQVGLQLPSTLAPMQMVFVTLPDGTVRSVPAAMLDYSIGGGVAYFTRGPPFPQ